MSFYPSLDFILKAKENYPMVPISYKVWSDQLTPIGLFQRIKGKYSFLLESVEGGEKWARYSFLGQQPDFLFMSQGKKAVIRHLHPEVQEAELEGEPLELLKQILSQFRTPQLEGLPRFCGGAVGYFGYEAVQLLEDLPKHVEQGGTLDDIRLMFCHDIIAFDHLQQEIIFISHVKLDPSLTTSQVEALYEQACSSLVTRVAETLEGEVSEAQQFFQLPAVRPQVDWEKVQANMDRATYERSIERIKEYIRAGDVFQTVFSQRFTVSLQADPFDVYRVLRTVNPSPYMYYLDLGDELVIVGSSPERLVLVEEKRVETNPIAGTRKRGQTPEEDQQFAEELRRDEKEKAEHHMLLDLGRNDIGRVAKYGSVRVTKQLEIERFSHVMHMVSTVEGELKDDLHPVDALFSCFPAGTVSGAPKIRAMEIIAELEAEARNVYAGAIGYFSYTGQLDSCIAIRTMVVSEGKAMVQAGGGIVADSCPFLEWEESRNKASAVLAAIQLAEQLFERRTEQEVDDVREVAVTDAQTVSFLKVTKANLNQVPEEKRKKFLRSASVRERSRKPKEELGHV